MITFVSFTVGVNSLQFQDFDSDPLLKCRPRTIGYILTGIKKIFISQLAIIIVYITFYSFFTQRGVSMSDNFVQANYEKYGVWGEIYTREFLIKMGLISLI